MHVAEFRVEDDRLTRYILLFMPVLMEVCSCRHCFGYFISLFGRNDPFLDENVA